MNPSINPIVYLAFQVIPRSHNINNYELVDKAIEVVKSSGVLYQVSAMETTMKGSLNQLLEIVKKAQQTCLDNGAIEVLTNIKIHNSPIGVSDTFCTFEF
ncbi:MAG: thiamine-binding protein [Legionellales bacterium]|nr:thiamine-binding protein [Legionellales bacterium]